MNKLKAIEKLIAYFDNQENTASKLGVKQPTVSGWLTGKHGVSEIVAMRAERLTSGAIKAIWLCPRLKAEMALS